MPEEIALMILEHAQTLHIPEDDRRYAIVGLERYKQPTTIVGIQKAQSGQPMVAKYAMILRVEFVPQGKETHPKLWPVKDVYFKILPKGLSGFKGILVGAPTLDAPPHGLGHRVTEATHYWKAIDIHTERLEMKRRGARVDEVKQWMREGNFDDVATEEMRALRECARETEAYYDGPELTLTAGERAVVPVTWSNNIPQADFYCAEAKIAAVASHPGVMEGGVQDSMLCIANEKIEDVLLEPGQTLAQAVPPPRNMQLIRKGLHPESGAMPEWLCEHEGALTEMRYENTAAEALRRAQEELDPVEDSCEPDPAEDSCPSLTDDSGSDSGDPELMQPREEELNAAQDECEERIEENGLRSLTLGRSSRTQDRRLRWNGGAAKLIS